MATLYLIATPLGNLEDITYRAVRILGEVEALACEDTRRTRILYEHYHIPSPRTIFSCHEHNEEAAAKRIAGLLDSGVNVGLTTNAGFPCISDPGYRPVVAAVERGHRVEAIPGPSAVPTALAVSGLPAASYTFKGFPPRKSGARKRFLEMEKDLPHTLVLYESPFRIAALLQDAYEVLGDRPAALCLELTKKFEEVHRYRLGEMAEMVQGAKLRGEITVVIAGNNPKLLRQPAEPDLELPF